MIDPYCSNLQDFFAKAVYYGLLREQDAQCFSVESSIQSGFFYLAGGAAILALLNAFVTKAVIQYFREDDSVDKRRRISNNNSDLSITNSSYSEDEGNDGSAVADAGFSARIQPVPVLFTDTFRWLLRGETNLPRSNRAIFANSEDDDHWDLPEARAFVYDEGMDAGIFQDGRHVADESASKNTGRRYGRSSPSAGPKSTVCHSHQVHSAARRLAYEEDRSSMQPSIMDSVSSQSIRSYGVRSTSAHSSARRGNLKDDLTYATPPGDEPRLRSQPRIRADDSSIADRSCNRSTISLPRSLANQSMKSTTSLPRSLASQSIRSASSASASSKRLPREQLREEDFSLEEGRTVEDLLEEELDEEEYLEAATRDSQSRSEYVEESLDEEFEEYTVQTMSDILEEETQIYEDYSQYSDDRSRRVI